MHREGPHRVGEAAPLPHLGEKPARSAREDRFQQIQRRRLGVAHLDPRETDQHQRLFPRRRFNPFPQAGQRRLRRNLRKSYLGNQDPAHRLLEQIQDGLPLKLACDRDHQAGGVQHLPIKADQISLFQAFKRLRLPGRIQAVRVLRK
jgi:hypothetical protein